MSGRGVVLVSGVWCRVHLSACTFSAALEQTRLVDVPLPTYR